MHWKLFGVLTALAALVGVPLAAHAQSGLAFTSPYLEWSLRPDVPRVPYDGAPFSERYISAFYASTPLMYNGNPSRLWYLDYLDRVDRAQRFGYELPAAYQAFPPSPPNPPRHGILWNLLHRGN